MIDARLLSLLALAAGVACRDERAAAPSAEPPRAPATAPAATAAAPTATASIAAPSSTTAAALRAQAVLGPFKVALRDTLTAALAQGPEAAIEACALSAPALATAASTGGARVGRAAPKLRNPANAPPAWVVGPMAELARAPREGAHRVVPLEGGRVGYVETIVVKPMCLACHGAAVAAPVAARLAARYPSDAATGFREGDFRGVFWAELP